MIVSPDLTVSADFSCPLFPKKNVYRSRVSAHDAARHARARTGESIRAYRCGKHYHLGHPAYKRKGAA